MLKLRRIEGDNVRHKLLCFLTLVSITLTMTVKAASCSYTEQAQLNKIAGAVNVSYDVKEETLDPSLSLDNVSITNYYLELVIMNLSPEIYLNISNDLSGAGQINNMIINYSDTNNGESRMRWDSNEKIAKFTIDVMSSASTSCPNDKITVKTFIMPKENEYFYYSICSGSNHKYCKQFIDFEEPSENELSKALGLDGDDSEEEQTITNESKVSLTFIKSPIFIGATVGVIIVISIIVIISRRKNTKNRGNKKNEF